MQLLRQNKERDKIENDKQNRPRAVLCLTKKFDESRLMTEPNKFFLEAS